MFQVLIEKTADWLFPVILGLGVWYGLHYAVLTPRIMMVDMPDEYQEFYTAHDLPKTIGECIKSHIAPAILQHGRLEAALFTATLKHINQPFQEKLLIAEASLDDTCGISKARQQQRDQEAKLLEQQKLAAKKTRLEALAKKKRELEQKAQEQYQQQIKKQMNFFIDLLTGDK